MQKEIILPLAQIFSTLLVGGVVAFYLNRRTNRDKIKGLLIDSYMEYLTIFKNFKIYQKNSLTEKVYRYLLTENFYLSYSDIEEKLESKIKDIQAKYDADWFDKYANLLNSTYKFTFLLGVKKTAKLLKPLEENPEVKGFLSDELYRNKFVGIIAKQIMSDSSVKASLIRTANEHINRIDILIKIYIEKAIFKELENYNSELAALIVQY